MSPEEIRSIRERLGLTQVEAGKLLGGGPRAFTKYESGTVEPAASVINLLRVLDAQPDAIATLGGAVPRRGAGYRPLPFEVGGEDIERLSYATLPELLRRLLHAEALAHGLPQDGIHVAGDINTPDGGEDGRIEWEGGPDRTTFLPARHCLFQTKAGEIAPVQAAREILKPAVRHGISIGGSYIVMCGHRYVHQLIDRRRARMCDALRKAGLQIKDDQIHFRDADQIAAWANHHPAVSMWVKEHSQPNTVGPFRSWSDWASSFEHDGSPWVEDERLIELTVWLRERVTVERRVARLVGLWGIGKTRLTLEALRACGSYLSAIVMYAADSESEPYKTNETVRNLAATGKRAIVVVDECSIERHRVLANLALRDGSRLSLITIDDEGLTDSLDESTFVISEAPSSVTEAVIRQVRTPLHSEDERRLMQFSKGFPKIAIRLAQVWRTTPLASATDSRLVDNFVLGGNPTERDLRIKSVALLATFRWVRLDSEAEPQLDEIASLGRSLTAADLQSAISFLLDRKTAKQTGGFFVIRPLPIGLQLAERQWKEWSSATWEKVLVGGTSEYLRVSAARQLALLNDTKIAKEVTNSVCRIDGPLDGVGARLSMTNAEVLSLLAEVDTRAVSGQIERILARFDARSKIGWEVADRLVRAAEKIAFDSSTFEAGAYLLLRLAVDATVTSAGTSPGDRFRSLFPVFLGNTAADSDSRLAVLDCALDTENPTQLDFVAKALTAGSMTSRFSRGVGAETHGARPALRTWRPTTPRESHDYIVGCVSRLGRLARRKDDVGITARAGIVQRLSSLLAAGFVDPLENVIRQVSEVVDSWTGALNSLSMMLSHEAPWLDDDTVIRLRKLVEELQPRRLVARIRSHVTNGVWDHTFNKKQFIETPEHYRLRVKAIRQIAIEATQQPAELMMLLPELSCGRQSLANEFGKAIGERDTCQEWLEPMVEAVVQTTPDDRNYDLLTGYLLGISSPEVITAFKHRAARSPELAPSLPLICRQLGITSDDIELMIEALRNELLPSWRLREWLLQGSLTEVSDTVLAPLFDVLIEQDAKGFVVAVDLIESYIHGDPRRLKALHEQVHKMVQNVTRWALGYDEMSVYSFKGIVLAVLEKGRRNRMARAIALELTRVLVDSDYYRDTYLLESVLPILLSGFPEISWPLIGQAIVLEHGNAWRLEEILGDSSFDAKGDAIILSLPEDTLFAWCHAHPDGAPAFAGRVLPVLLDRDRSSTPVVHPRITRLVEEFGERKDVQQAIMQNIESSGWIGSKASVYAQLEAPLRALDTHREPQVRDWAKKILKDLGDRKREAMRDDEEQEVRAELSQW